MKDKETKREDFRIIQYADDVFEVQIHTERERIWHTGFLWLKKKHSETTRYWKKSGKIDWDKSNRETLYFHHVCYNTLEDARKWIDDYFKYPITHEA